MCITYTVYIYILHSNYQHQLCIPWVARLCLTVVSCWKCLYTLITPQAFTCARTRKESISCRSTASAKIIIIIIIIIVIIKIIKIIIIIIIIIIITVLDLLSFQGKVQKKNAGKDVYQRMNLLMNEWMKEGRMEERKKYERMPCEMDDLLNNWCQYWFWSSSQLWSAGCTCLALNKSRCSLSTSSLSWERDHSLWSLTPLFDDFSADLTFEWFSNLLSIRWPAQTVEGFRKTLPSICFRKHKSQWSKSDFSSTTDNTKAATDLRSRNHRCFSRPWHSSWHCRTMGVS